ncbi:TPA: DUF106 domain-containing protein, partial [Candidatus Micrarchaeota archaeon]|nr:DUF106 domain-containing protein [Candidatus Micrarchaeota archaeon]
NRTWGERKKLQAIQKQMNAFQKEYAAAMKSKDERKLKEMEVREKEIGALTKDMLILPFKAMIVILPLFLIAMWLLESMFSQFKIILPIGLHLGELLSLNVLHESVYGVRGYFIVSSAIVSIVIEMVWSQVEKMMEKNKTPSPAAN